MFTIRKYKQLVGLRSNYRICAETHIITITLILNMNKKKSKAISLCSNYLQMNLYFVFDNLTRYNTSVCKSQFTKILHAFCRKIGLSVAILLITAN